MKDSSVLFEQFREEKELAQVIFDASLDDFSIMKLVYAWEQWGFLKRLVQEDREDLHNSLAEVMSPAADSLEGGTPKFSLQETMELPRQMLEDVQMATEVPSDVAEPSLDSGPMAELDLELARDELPFEDDGVEEVSPWMQRRWVQLLGSALIVTLGLLAVVLVTHPPRLPDPPAETGIEDGLSVIETLEASSPKMDPEGVPTSTEEGPQAAEGETDEVTVQEEDAGVEPAPLIDPVALPDSLEVASPPSETPSEVVTEGVVEPPQIQVTEPDTTLPVERMVSPIIGNLPQRGAKPVPSADSRQKQEVKEEVPRSTPVPEKGKEIKGEDQPPQGRQIESKPTLDPYELMNQQRFSEAAALFRDRWSEGSGMTYTIAVELACQHETLVHAFVTAQGDADFFVLPATFQGRLCFWVCYGRFATREAAEAQFKILPNEFLYFDPPPKIRRLRDLMVDAP
jgi:septal ring-binding cell division protein DamX